MAGAQQSASPPPHSLVDLGGVYIRRLLCAGTVLSWESRAGHVAAQSRLLLRLTKIDAYYHEYPGGDECREEGRG